MWAGTFTDIVFTDTDANRTLTHKVASTPADPSRAFMRGVKEICADAGVGLAALDHIFHGTTVATNAALQHRGARAGMITTRGFRDILHIGRHQRPQHYSIQQGIPWQDRPLVQRRHRKVVTERLAPPRGEIVVPLAEAEVEPAALELKEAGVASIAICFLFSYINPENEKRAKAIVQRLCPDVFVTCSHEVSPQFREFERFTTTAMNAFIGPLVRDYIARLSAELTTAGFRGEVHIMQSNGGVAPARAVSGLPVHTLMSGLAAGVLGGAWVAELAGRRNVVTLDIGGTSADIGVVTDGRFEEASARDTFVAGYPILVPMIDLHTIGAGGGSIAHVDAAGAFRVGPQSAGAVPGPAAYGQGGKDATVTDANIVLGRLDVQNFLGGAMRLDRVAAFTAVQAAGGQARPAVARGRRRSRRGAERATWRMRSVRARCRRESTRASTRSSPWAARARCTARKSRRCSVFRRSSCHRIPGSTPRSDCSRPTSSTRWSAPHSWSRPGVDLERLNTDLAAMEASVRTQLAADGLDPAAATFHRSADARYVGQGYELRLEMPQARIGAAELDAALARFHALHEREYGHHFEQSPIELVNLRVTAVAQVPKIRVPPKPAGGSLAAARLRTADAVFRVGVELESFATTFYDRGKLPLGADPGPRDHPAGRFDDRRAAALHGRSRRIRFHHPQASARAARQLKCPVHRSNGRRESVS